MQSPSSSLSFSSVLVCLLVSLAALVVSQDSGLPGGSEDILSAPYTDSFSCEGQAYGYYADIDNNCEVKIVENKILKFLWFPHCDVIIPPKFKF